jgi:hypothetical protein
MASDSDDGVDQVIADASQRWLRQLSVGDEAAARLRYLLERASIQMTDRDPEFSAELRQRIEAWSTSDSARETASAPGPERDVLLDPLKLPLRPSIDVAAALRPDNSASSVWGLDALWMEHRDGAPASLLSADQLAAVRLLFELHRSDVVPARSIGWAVALVPDDGLPDQSDLDAFSAVLADSGRNLNVATSGEIKLDEVPIAVLGLRPGAITAARSGFEDGSLNLVLELGVSAPVFSMCVALVDEQGSLESWQRLHVPAHEPGTPRRWSGTLDVSRGWQAVVVSTVGGLDEALDRAAAAAWWYRTGWLLDGLGQDSREAWMRAANWWDSVGDTERAEAARSDRGDGRFRTPVYGLISELTRQADYLLAGARRGYRADAAVAAKVYRLISDFGGQAAAVDLETELE